MKNGRALLFIIILIITTMAFRPVFAIGGSEILLILVLIVFLLWPLIVRFYKAWQKNDHEDKKDNKK